MNDFARSQMTEERSADQSGETQYKEAVQAMEKGNEGAKALVAFYKLSGYGGARIDAEGAVALLEDRARDGDCEAKWMLGLCCEYGMGIEQNIERAKVLYQESYEGGNVAGEFLMKNGFGERGSGEMKVNGL